MADKVVIGNATLYLGDCMDILPTLPKVDAVITDPPYGTVGGMGKGEKRYARLTGAEWDVAIEPAVIFDHCNRLLRVNGALLLFSQEPYTARLITQAHGNVPFSYRMTWLKDHFSNSLLANSAPVNYTEDVLVFFKKYDTLAQHPLREYSVRVLQHCGGDLKQINETLGHRRAEHFFYVESTQYGLCTAATYAELCEQYGIDREPWFMPYGELEEVNRRFSRRFSRRFNLQGKQYKSNVLSYRKDYTSDHPTQKPVALMADLVKTYTEPGEMVLDFTMGSGSTGVACCDVGRSFIGIEREPKYFDIACKRIEQAVAQGQLFEPEPVKQVQEGLL